MQQKLCKKIGKEVSGGKKKPYRYYCNEEYFQNVKTYEQAYWLGFIMADGCIYQRKNQNSQKWVQITLQQKDALHLEKFKKAINSNHPIKNTTHKNNGLKYCTITIVSNKMADDLTKFGCVENKTGNISLPKFDNTELTWGFINGYIDGDGSIVRAKDKNVFGYRLSIVGNKEIIYDIENFIFYKLGFHGKIREYNRKYAFPFYEVFYERMEFLDPIFKSTYLKNIIYLDRKYDRVIKYYKEKYDDSKLFYNLCRS